MSAQNKTLSKHICLIYNIHFGFKGNFKELFLFFPCLNYSKSFQEYIYIYMDFSFGLKISKTFINLTKLLV